MRAGPCHALIQAAAELIGALCRSDRVPRGSPEPAVTRAGSNGRGRQSAESPSGPGRNRPRRQRTAELVDQGQAAGPVQVVV